MKQRHRVAERFHALATLQHIRAKIGQDFYTLNSAQIELL